jgi:hypothetical protein
MELLIILMAVFSLLYLIFNESVVEDINKESFINTNEQKKELIERISNVHQYENLECDNDVNAKPKLIIFEYPNFEGNNWVLGNGEFSDKILIHHKIPLKSIGSCILMPNTKVFLYRHGDFTGIMHDKENLTYSLKNPYDDLNRKIPDFVELGWYNQLQSIKIENLE